LVLHLATHADFGKVLVLNAEHTPSTRSLAAKALSGFDYQTKDVSYLQFFDQKLKFRDLAKLDLGKAVNVELFVISACNTATGDDEAELGFAGLSLQMGARSALASLWQVSDVGTMVLMGEFYNQLNQKVSRSQALRQAQLAMLRGQVGTVTGNRLNIANRAIALDAALQEQMAGDGETLNLRHPFYWSAFTLIGSPW
jgi:CHAT domain-containing protein